MNMSIELELENKEKIICHILFTSKIEELNRHYLVFYKDNDPQLYTARYIPNASPFRLYNDLSEEEINIVNAMIEKKFSKIEIEAK